MRITFKFKIAHGYNSFALHKIISRYKCFQKTLFEYWIRLIFTPLFLLVFMFYCIAHYRKLFHRWYRCQNEGFFKKEKTKKFLYELQKISTGYHKLLVSELVKYQINTYPMLDLRNSWVCKKNTFEVVEYLCKKIASYFFYQRKTESIKKIANCLEDCLEVFDSAWSIWWLVHAKLVNRQICQSRPAVPEFQREMQVVRSRPLIRLPKYLWGEDKTWMKYNITVTYQR